MNYVERSETARREYEREIETVPVWRRIYVDESGASQFCYRTHACTLGEKCVYGFIRRKKFARVNVVVGYCDGQISGEYCYTGSTTSKKFEDWFCDFLLPETQKGDVIIMDNASFHNNKRLRKYAWVYKVTIIFLPPYSPDYNPIEHVRANLKRYLHNTKQQSASLQSAVYRYFTIAGS